MLDKIEKRNELFINAAFKKWYLIITCAICLLWVVIAFVLTIFNVEFIKKEIFNIYYNAIIIVLVIVGMIIDEKVRKNPGVIVTIGTSIYCFSYIALCSLNYGFSKVIYPLIFICIIGLSYVVYKKIYPSIIVVKNMNKVFNTIYLIVLLSITLLIGMVII